MAANKTISLNDVDQAIDFTIVGSDEQRAANLVTLQRVLCAEAVPLVREKVRLTEKFGAADPRVVRIAEQIEINKGLTSEVIQETVRAQIDSVLVDAHTWVLHGFVRDVEGAGLANLTIAPYDSVKPDANWVKELGHVCTDDRGYFKLEASNLIRDYSATPVYVHVLNAPGATLYLDDAPLTPKGGQLNYREFVISGKTLDCPPPPPPPDVDLSITKVESPDPVAPDADLTYTLTVTNHTRAEAKDVKVTDTLPAQTTFVSASGGGFTCTHSNGVVNCTLLTLAAEATATIKLVVKVSPDTKHGTVLNNTAAVTATTNDPDTANNTAATTTTVVRAADLSIAKTDAPNPVVAGANITYTLTIKNDGPNVAENVKVTDTLPAQTTFVSASGGGFTCAHGNGVVNCTLPALAARATATITIVVKVSPDAKHGTVLNNTVTVTATTNDPDTDNNTAAATTTVVSAADLSITKTDAPKKVAPGADITYTLTVTNAGPSAAESVKVTDPIPANTAFISAKVTSGEGWTPNTALARASSAGDVVFSKPSVANGETATFEIVVRVNADTTTVTTISNTATVTSPTTDPNAGNNTATATTTVKPLNADLSITKTDAPKKVAPGADITYTLTIGNNGPNAAEEVVITDTLESGLGFVSIEAPDYSVNTPRAGASGTIKCTRPTLAVGQSTRITIVARLRPAAAGGTLPSNVSNTANVSAKTPDLDPTNNTATATTTVKPLSADLSITKTDAPNRVAPGADITYTLTITNNGPNAAENVAVTDAIPADTAFVLSKVTSGEDWITSNPSAREFNNVVFAKTTVAAGETASFQIVVRLNKNTTLTRISNTATVTSSTTDPDSANNTIEAITKVQQQTQTRRALVVFTEVNKAGDHTPLQGSTQPLVTFIDNVPNSGDLEAAFKSPPSGFALNQFKGITMASVVDKLDAGIQVRLNAVGSALTKAGGASTLRTSTVVLSAGDQTTLASRKISIADIDEVIFLEL